MPIHHLPNGKWRWGSKGAEYNTKAEAQKQARAAYWNGYREKDSNPDKTKPKDAK